MDCKDFYKMNQRNEVSCVNLYPKQSVGEPSIIKDKDKYIPIQKIARIKGLKSTRLIRLAINQGKYIARDV